MPDTPLDDQRGSVVGVSARERPTMLTKQQLATRVGRATRWIELRVREGMPAGPLDRFGRRRYDVAAVEAWIAAVPAAPRNRANPPVPRTEARIAALEAAVAELRERLDRVDAGGSRPPRSPTEAAE